MKKENRKKEKNVWGGNHWWDLGTQTVLSDCLFLPLPVFLIEEWLLKATFSHLSKPFRKKYTWVSAHLTYTRMFPHICKLIQGRLDWTCLDYSFFLAFIFAMGVRYHEWLSLGHLLYFVTIRRFELGHCYLKTSPWPGKIMVGQFSPPNKGGEQTKPTEVLPICQPRTLHILDAW